MKKCSQSIKYYHFRWYKKITKRDCFKHHPCLSNQMSRALMSNSFGSLHIRKKWGKSRVLANNRVFRGKTGFYLPLPVKPEVYSQTREISRVWRYRVHIYICIYIYISMHMYVYIYTYSIHIYTIHISQWSGQIPPGPSWPVRRGFVSALPQRFLFYPLSLPRDFCGRRCEAGKVSRVLF